MTRNGADLLIATAESLGVTTCFANPGTTELHMVDALGRARSMRTVLTLFEGVASGAADGFARMTGTPALGLFHLGPGFANSLANQHNARRHGSPMINLIGDHTTWHRAVDAPLHSEIELLSRWVGTSFEVGSADEAGRQMVEAFAHATSGTGRTATVVFPSDAAWSATTVDTPTPNPVPAPDPVHGATSGHPTGDEPATVAAELRGSGAVIIAGGARLSRRALGLLAAISRETGATAYANRVARIELGRDVHGFEDLPYFPEPLTESLVGATVAVMVGRSEPVTFFGYPDHGSHALPPDCRRLVVADHGEPVDEALEALAQELGVVNAIPAVDPPAPVVAPAGPLTTASIGAVFASAIPDGAIVLGEAVTSAAGYRSAAAGAEPHTLLSILGGAIGGGLPAAVGAAVACPDRPVLALQADGSALYTIQSLWTMARESLDVTVVICANRAYRILAAELSRANMDPMGQAASLVDLTDPTVDFCSLARGFGVEAEQVDNGRDLVAAMGRGVAVDGPYLIEAVMS